MQKQLTGLPWNIQWAEATSLQAARRTATARPLNFMIREYRGWMFVWYSESSLQNPNKCGKPIQFIPPKKRSVELQGRLLRSPVAGPVSPPELTLLRNFGARSTGAVEPENILPIHFQRRCCMRVKKTCYPTILRDGKPNISRNSSTEDPIGTVSCLRTGIHYL